MLQSIRDRATGWIAWIIVILLSIPFALFGIQQYFSADSSLPVAVIDGNEIPQREFRNRYDRMLANMTQQRQGQLTDKDQERLKESVLDSMITAQLLNGVALEEGYAIGPAQLRAAITSMPEFRENGSFSRELYGQMLQYNGMSEEQFEAEQANSMRLDQVQNAIARTSLLPDEAVLEFLKAERQARDIDEIRFEQAALADPDAISDADIEAYYAANGDRFQAPELVKVEYLDLNAKTMGGDRDISEADIEAWYASHKEQFTSAESRRVAHILVSVASDADEDALSAARERILALETQLKDGAEFAELAKTESDDTGTGAEGGDLGFVQEGDLDPALTLAMNQLEVGQVSDPVRSPFGWHLLKLLDIEGGEVRPLADVREQAIAQLTAERSNDEFYAKGQDLANLTYEEADSLLGAAQAIGLEIQTSVYFHVDGPNDPLAPPEDVSHLEPVRAAAFSDDVRSEGLNSPVIRISDDRVIVLRLADLKPPRQKDLDEVASEIRVILAKQAASEKAEALAIQAMERIKAGEEAAEVAEALGGQLRSHSQLSRISPGIPEALRDMAFRMPKPNDGKPSIDTVALEDGSHAVVRVLNVKDGDASELGEAEMDFARRGLARLAGSTEFEAYVRHLRERAEVTINRDNL
ncbi:MAG: SurA N-terminal domain-containing protein [Gammaproteobacteria bacterium]